ncbi:MAG: thiamine pyrophosphate-dependent dehydrogenase E1 component subunit alpha [Candidatus Tectomicrobia bacterium]|uniref:Thiamine pyrophosphate-dependent dehydrogenase E1 component subunit alpha n=1 Tax=Tectimicrobiota bacterium TaxID=2528274 RepID=A0A933GN70_UNCTE|nr:thiamine pyrophosphate-dependent dehydrogenase E1 component subunit alpha [Candidatus Tectomicrobia bacterium]
MELTESKLLEFLRVMLSIRHFELKCAEVFAQGKIPGFVHLYVGEEAVAAGACATIRKDDYIVSNHRGHGHCIAKGGDLKKMMAEIFGRAEGYCKGKGGSMHIADLDLGILGANGIVGGGLAIAPGAGLSAKLRKTDQVTLCFFGDGASNEGTFHEGLNLASVWHLPVIFICENNLYGISVSQSSHQNIRDISCRAQAYGVPGVSIDGNDVLTVYDTVSDAVKRARAGDGPTLVECKTYRMRGHFEGDPMVYRSKEEMQEWAKKDPIERYKDKLSKMKGITIRDLEAMEEEIKVKVDEAVKYAEECPPPDPDKLLEDIYAP